MQILKGLSVSGGVAIGKAFVLASDFWEIPEKKLRPNQVEAEVRRYLQSLKETARHIEQNRSQAERDLGKVTSQIFEAYSEIINDVFFTEKIPEQIRLQRRNAETVLRRAVLEYSSSIQTTQNEYLKERLSDIFAVERWILRWLVSPSKKILTEPPEDAVLIARELFVQMVMNMDRRRFVAIVTEKGGLTGHAAILARSYKIPAVVQVQGILEAVADGTPLVVDGDAGKVIVEPQPELVQKYRMKLAEQREHWEILQRKRFEPAVTRDGQRIKILANIGSEDEAREAVGYGAEGVGLFRTEYPFLEAGKFLDEEEQYEIYREVVEILDGREVTIRTLDVGADKLLFPQQSQMEANPLLGLRSIRYFLTRDLESLTTQLRAIFRASAHGRVKILYPMVTTVEELLAVGRAYTQVRAQLLQEKVAIDRNLERGVMVEIPSAALLSDHFITQCSFLSVGTNDLIQYTLAVDRNNGSVAELYQPLNPAILRLIHMAVQAARRHGKEISVCGEMASEVLYVPLLIGLGVTVLSMNPVAIPLVKETVRTISFRESQKLAEEALKCGTVDEVLAVLNRQANQSP